DDAERIELAPERIELGKRRIAPVPEAGPYRRSAEALFRYPAQFLDRALDALDRQHRAREEPRAIGGTVVVDPVVVGAREDLRGAGIAQQGKAHEPGREEHHLIGADRIHVLEARVRIAAAQEAAEFRLPFRRSRLELSHLLLAPARPADLGGIRALARGRH